MKDSKTDLHNITITGNQENNLNSVFNEVINTESMLFP
jgi:hypothetical protein